MSNMSWKPNIIYIYIKQEVHSLESIPPMNPKNFTLTKLILDQVLILDSCPKSTLSQNFLNIHHDFLSNPV